MDAGTGSPAPGAALQGDCDFRSPGRLRAAPPRAGFCREAVGGSSCRYAGAPPSASSGTSSLQHLWAPGPPLRVPQLCWTSGRRPCPHGAHRSRASRVAKEVEIEKGKAGGRSGASRDILRMQSRPGGGAVSRAPASPRCPARLGQSPRCTPASPCSLRGLRGCCVQTTPGQSRGAPGSLHSPSRVGLPFCGAQPRPYAVPPAEAEQAGQPAKPS